MSKRKGITIGLTLILCVLGLSGCLKDFDFDDFSITTTYYEITTKISYTISYGYEINCSGVGEYMIKYNCDKPEVFRGLAMITDILYDYDYDNTTSANNSRICWNINGTGDNVYRLGITASVEAESFLVSNLNGAGALTLKEIKTDFPNIFNQYCHEQSLENTVYIDPDNPSIKSTAQAILNQANSANSFNIAKELFIWLKQNIACQAHAVNTIVQPANTTYQLGTGDCDDLSFLYISLCRSIGIPARSISGFVVKGNSEILDTEAHGWAEVFVGKNISSDGWIPVECASSSSDMDFQIVFDFGVEGADNLRLFKDKGSNESLNAYIYGSWIQPDEGMHINMTPFVEVNNYSVLESREFVIDESSNRVFGEYI